MIVCLCQNGSGHRCINHLLTIHHHPTLYTNNQHTPLKTPAIYSCVRAQFGNVLVELSRQSNQGLLVHTLANPMVWISVSTVDDHVLRPAIEPGVLPSWLSMVARCLCAHSIPPNHLHTFTSQHACELFQHFPLAIGPRAIAAIVMDLSMQASIEKLNLRKVQVSHT
mgnify:CR=1 FL=1